MSDKGTKDKDKRPKGASTGLLVIHYCYCYIVIHYCYAPGVSVQDSDMQHVHFSVQCLHFVNHPLFAMVCSKLLCTRTVQGFVTWLNCILQINALNYYVNYYAVGQGGKARPSIMQWNVLSLDWIVFCRKNCKLQQNKARPSIMQCNVLSLDWIRWSHQAPPFVFSHKPTNPVACCSWGGWWNLIAWQYDNDMRMIWWLKLSC